MTGQKERACPCANTDKLKERIETLLTPEYNTDPEWLQYAGVLYYAVDDRGRKFQASTVLRLSDPQLGKLIHWLQPAACPVSPRNAAAKPRIPAGRAALPV